MLPTDSRSRPGLCATRERVVWCCLLISLYAASAAFMAVLCYWAVVLALEIWVMPSLRVPGAPTLSYGAALVLVVTPLVAVQGASFGVAAYLARARKRLAAIMVCVAGSIGGFALLGCLWLGDLNRYGLEPSAIVLCLPGALFSLFAFSVAMTWIPHGKGGRWC
jgi:hypothetical protein